MGIVAALLLGSIDTVGMGEDGDPGVSLALSDTGVGGEALGSQSTPVSQKLLQMQDKKTALTGPDKEMDSDIDTAASGLEHWLFARALKRGLSASPGSTPHASKSQVSDPLEKSQERQLAEHDISRTLSFLNSKLGHTRINAAKAHMHTSLDTHTVNTKSGGVEEGAGRGSKLTFSANHKHVHMHGSSSASSLSLDSRASSILHWLGFTHTAHQNDPFEIIEGSVSGHGESS